MKKIFSFFRSGFGRKDSSKEELNNQYKIFDKTQHLKPLFDRQTFDNLSGWDFGWAIIDTINIIYDIKQEENIVMQFSPGQKLLHFFWYLDAQVVNGGFIQFYWNGYRKYIPPIIEGLKLINDTHMIELINDADSTYLENRKLFIKQRKKDDWNPIYVSSKKFGELDDGYFKLHDNTMSLIEQYARKNPDEFVQIQ